MKLRAPYLTLLLVLTPGLSVAQAQQQDTKRDFETIFLAENFSAIRFAEPKRVEAGDMLSAVYGGPLNSLRKCVPQDWDEVYSRGDATFAATSGSTTRSGELDATTKSFFKLSGTVSVLVTSSISDNGSLSVQSDSARIETLWAEDILRTDDERCNVYADLYANRYIPNEYLIVEKAFFFGGDVSHAYQLSLNGSGAGTVGLGKIREFLEKIPFLDGLGSLFEINAELRVSGESITSNTLRFSYGEQQKVVDAIGFQPIAIREGLAVDLVNSVDELPEGRAMLISASLDFEAATMFLESNPAFDIGDEGSLMANMFVGEELTLYRKFVEGDEELSTVFAEIFSRILNINRLADREV